EGDLVQVSSRRGTVRLPARLSSAVPAGTVFLPFHWGDLFAQANAVNYLTISATDTISRQPELKFCAVALERVASAGEPRNGHERSLLVPVVLELPQGAAIAYPAQARSEGLFLVTMDEHSS